MNAILKFAGKQFLTKRLHQMTFFYFYLNAFQVILKRTKNRYNGTCVLTLLLFSGDGFFFFYIEQMTTERLLFNTI